MFLDLVDSIIVYGILASRFPLFLLVHLVLTICCFISPLAQCCPVAQNSLSLIVRPTVPWIPHIQDKLFNSQKVYHPFGRKYYWGYIGLFCVPVIDIMAQQRAKQFHTKVLLWVVCVIAAIIAGRYFSVTDSSIGIFHCWWCQLACCCRRRQDINWITPTHPLLTWLSSSMNNSWEGDQVHWLSGKYPPSHSLWYQSPILTKICYPAHIGDGVSGVSMQLRERRVAVGPSDYSTNNHVRNVAPIKRICKTKHDLRHPNKKIGQPKHQVRQSKHQQSKIRQRKHQVLQPKHQEARFNKKN